MKSTSTCNIASDMFLLDFPMVSYTDPKKALGVYVQRAGTPEISMNFI